MVGGFASITAESVLAVIKPVETPDVPEDILDAPTFVGGRKDALRDFGGDLDDLYNVPRWDGGKRSNDGSCHKDHKENWRTWKNR